MPRTLRLVSDLVLAQSAAEVAGIGLRTELVPGMRGFLILVVGVQVLCALRVQRFSPVATLGLFVLQATTVLAGLTSHASLLLRAGLVGSAATVLVVLSRSLKYYPEPDLRLPDRSHR